MERKMTLKEFVFTEAMRHKKTVNAIYGRVKRGYYRQHYNGWRLGLKLKPKNQRVILVVQLPMR
jgi:hypothetical protein